MALLRGRGSRQTLSFPVLALSATLQALTHSLGAVTFWIVSLSPLCGANGMRRSGPAAGVAVDVCV